MYGLARRGGGRFLLSHSTYLFGVIGRLNENKTNKQTIGSRISPPEPVEAEIVESEGLGGTRRLVEVV